MSGQIITLEHTSRVLAGNPLGDPAARRLPVYLPPSYDESTAYPVIWVLAPFTSWGERFFNLKAWDENIIQRMDRLIAMDEAEPAIMAFPDCFTSLGGSQYVNSAAVGRYEDYVIEELIPFLEDQIPNTNGRRGVVGHSSGGFGALRLAMRHPGTFRAVGSHAGDMGFEWCYRPDIPAALRHLEQFDHLDDFIETIGQRDTGGKDWFPALNIVAMAACYSPGEHGEIVLPFEPYTGDLRPEVWARWLAHDPVTLAADHLDILRDLDLLYFDCGTGDEFNLFLGARALHQVLEENGVEHRYDEFDGGHHGLNWRYEFSLPLLTRALA